MKMWWIKINRKPLQENKQKKNRWGWVDGGYSAAPDFTYPDITVYWNLLKRWKMTFLFCSLFTYCLISTENYLVNFKFGLIEHIRLQGSTHHELGNRPVKLGLEFTPEHIIIHERVTPLWGGTSGRRLRDWGRLPAVPILYICDLQEVKDSVCFDITFICFSFPK